MGGVIQKSKLVYSDADLVDSADLILCPSATGKTGSTVRNLSVGSKNGTLVDASFAMDQGYALRFEDSSTEVVTVPYYPKLNPKHITVSMWIYLESVDNVAFPVPLYHGTINDSYLFVIDSDNKPLFRVDTTVASNQDAKSTTTCNLNVWEHWVGSYDGTTIRFYRDGVLQGTKTTNGDLATNTGDLKIGAGGGNNCDCWIDDLRIYPFRQPPSQIKRLYKGGQGRGIGLRRSPVEYEPIRTLSYPNLRKGIVSAWGSNPGPLVRDEVGGNHFNRVGMLYERGVYGFPEAMHVRFLQGDYLESQSVPTGVTNKLTVSVWYWVETESNTRYGQVHTCTNSNYGWNLSMESHYDRWAWYIGNGTGYVSIIGPDPANDWHKWVHLLGTWDGETMEFFHNGESVGTAACSGSTCAPLVTIRQGWDHAETNMHAAYGLYHDSIVWNRVLSGQEIQQVWNGGAPDAIREMDNEVSPYVTQWGSVATAEAAFQAAWGSNATTIAGVASGR